MNEGSNRINAIIQSGIQKQLLSIILCALCFGCPLPQLKAAWLPPATLSFFPNTPSSIQGFVDNSGNAIIDWLDSGNNIIISSYYLYSTNTWSLPQTVTSETGLNSLPSITINAQGRAAALWVQQGSPDQLFISLYENGNWLPGTLVPAPVLIAGQSYETLSPNAIALDLFGNVIITYAIDDTNTNVTTIHTGILSANSWSFFTFSQSLPVGSISISPQIELDANGNGIINWATSGAAANVYGSNYVKSSQTFTNPPLTLFAGGSGSITNLQAVMTTGGIGLVGWNITPNGIYTSIYNGGWSPTAALIPNSSGLNVGSPSLAINNLTQAVLTFSN